MRIRARMVAFGTAVAALLSVPLVVSVTADASSDVLLSRNRPALASSTAAIGYDATRAVDSDAGSRWASVAGAGTQWLRIDLGGSRTVRRVRLAWERAYPTWYRVQTSADGAAWADLYATRAGDGGVDDLKGLDGAGRYVRVLATRRGTPYGYSLWELQVYGPGPTPPASPPVAVTTAVPPAAAPLTHPRRKDVALQLLATAEHGTLNWRSRYGHIEDVGDGRGYTAGIAGFRSGTSDMLALVEAYTRRKPRNPLATYLPALRVVDGSDSHAGLDPGYPAAWREAAADPVFQKVQEDERDRMYFGPAVTLARTDGLRALGQFAYYDAAVRHGMPGLRAIRAETVKRARTPRQGGDETQWLQAFLDDRVRALRTEAAYGDTGRVDTAQRVFLRQSNLDLNPPLAWRVHGDRFTIGD